ncbi:MAG: MFS transporter [Candidatus Omnitrophota bacterium]|nr:MFS transporter [Candidatus Omnitrophota bacterium]
MFNIIILGITSFLTDVSSEMIYPLIPVYLVTQLGVSPVILGLIEGVAESLASMLKVFSGYLSDKIKLRKPITIFGYTFSMIGKVFLYLSSSWHLVFWGRALDRFGKGVRTAPRDTLIAESSQTKNRGASFGLHRTMDTLGAVVGILLAYYLFTAYKGSFNNLFLFSLLPAVLGVLFLFLVKEKRKVIQESEFKQKLSFKWSNLDKRLRIFLIITFIFSLGNSSNQFLLLRAKNIGFNMATVILLYLTYNLSYAIFSWPAAWLSDRVGRKRILVIGYLVYAIVYLGFAITQSHSLVWFLFALYGIYSGFTEGVEKALIVDLAPRELRATSIGLHGMLVGIGLLPASLIAGLLWRFVGVNSPFYLGSVLSLLAGLALWLLI